MITNFRYRHSFLSNFYPAAIELENIIFPTAEHAYQAAKTAVPEEINSIITAATPAIAKQLGKRVHLRPDWSRQAPHKMFYIVRQKFIQHPSLMDLLIATGTEEIVEGNYWHDNLWGSCLCGRCSAGKNYLGRILMKIRQLHRG